MIASALAWMLARKWLAWLAVPVVVIAVFFGWRHVQRGIGAKGVIDGLREKHLERVEAGGRARRDSGSGSDRDKRLQKRFERD